MNSDVHTSEKLNQNKIFSVIPILIFISTVLAPLIEAYLISLISTPNYNQQLPYILAVIILIHLFSAYGTYHMTKQSSHYVDYVLLEKKYKSLQDRYEDTSHITNQVFACNQAIYMSTVGLDDYLGDYSVSNTDHEKKYINQILYPFINFRTQIFGLKETSLYNIALYKYNPTDDQLHVYHRFHDDRISTQNRSWAPGHGHIGLAFIRKKAILSADAQSSDELDFDNSNGDQKYYNSFFSIPILATSDSSSSSTNHPLGVLVVTSSSKAEFSREIHESTLLALSKLIAIYFELESSKEGDKHVE